MKNFKRITAAFLLIVSILVTAVPFSTEISAATFVYSKESNSGTRGVLCTTLDGTSAGAYYTGNYTYDKLDDLSDDALFDALQDLMRNTHTKITSYDDCRDYAFYTDCQNNNTEYGTTLYTSFQMTWDGHWKGGNWKCNREHVWPKNLGPGTNSSKATKEGGSDLHHIRPAEANVNTSRSDKKYGTGGSNSIIGKHSGVIGGIYTDTYFEPNDNVKGDVARICLYMYVRWNSDWGCDSLTKVFESVEVLLEWCALDPVDTWEMGRNEVVGAIQGNRNVFIDYPELAWLMLGYDIPEGMSTPSGKASAAAPSCKHTSTETRNKVGATCGKDGYSGDTYCKDCNTKISSGKKISATGQHSYGAWETVGDKQTSVCTVCGKSGERPAPECTHPETEVTGAFEPTCGSAGYTGDTRCKNCNSLISEGSEIPATHDHKNTERRGAAAPTCVANGSEGDLYCTDCGSLISSGAVIPATGEHTLVEGEIISQPTKKKDGLRMDKCEFCGYVEGVVLPKTGNDNTTVIIIAVVVGVVVCAAVIVTALLITKKKTK